MSTIKAAVVLTIALGLGGCAAQRQAKFDEIAANCRANVPAAVGSYVRRQRCFMLAAKQAGFSGPTQDLLDATGLQLAERVDRGEITPADAGAEDARLRYRIREEAAADQQQRLQTSAAIMGLLRPPQPWNTTCSRFGGIVNCFGN